MSCRPIKSQSRGVGGVRWHPSAAEAACGEGLPPTATAPAEAACGEGHPKGGKGSRGGRRGGIGEAGSTETELDVGEGGRPP